MAWRRLGNKQSYIWTNAELIHWCIYAALGGDELKGVQYQPPYYILHPVGLIGSLAGTILNKLVRGIFVAE